MELARVLTVGGADVTKLVVENITELILIAMFGTMTYYIKKIYNQWVTRGNTVDRLDQLINGMEGNNHFEGLIEVIEGHDQEIDNVMAKIEEIKMEQDIARDKRQELEKRLKRLKEKKATREELHQMENE